MKDLREGDAVRVPWLTVERVSAITDGVIAIIITLLVLEIKVPESHDIGVEGFWSFLGRSSRDIVVYLLNFVLIGVFWLQHHVIFHYLAKTNRTLVFLDGLFLFLLSLAPFATKLASAYRGISAAEGVFGANFLLSGIALLLLWQYAVNNSYLLRKPVDAAVVRSMRRRIMIAPVMILIGMAISAINFRAGAIVYFAIPLFYIKHRLVDTSWQGQE